MKKPSKVCSLLQGREGKEKAVCLGLGIAILFILAVVVPASLKARSSRGSGSNTAIVPVAASSDALSTDQEDWISANPTEGALSILPLDEDDDDAPSNSLDESSWTFLRPQNSRAPINPSETPSSIPDDVSFEPSTSPTESSTGAPSDTPSRGPSTSPTIDDSFFPGLLTHMEHGLLLSKGLTARIVAQTGQPVSYKNLTFGEKSTTMFHALPDFGACFVDTRVSNPGGWVYVSNSEVENAAGGVGGITFDAQGNVLKFDQLLTGTTMNCGGGRTPWDTWVSCEETEGGQAWQVDPLRPDSPPSRPITLGIEGGHWESFSYDDRDRVNPKFFITEDAERGALQRFSPYNVTSWSPDILYNPGKIEYLMLQPNSEQTGGTYYWGTNRGNARANAQQFYPNSEGIDVYGSSLYFVIKKRKQLFELNLDNGTYTMMSTVSGLFEGGPDQMKRILVDGAEDFL